MKNLGKLLRMKMTAAIAALVIISAVTPFRARAQGSILGPRPANPVSAGTTPAADGDPAHSALRLQGFLTIPAGEVAGVQGLLSSAWHGQTTKVPAGKRMVIEFISAECVVGNGDSGGGGVPPTVTGIAITTQELATTGWTTHRYVFPDVRNQDAGFLGFRGAFGSWRTKLYSDGSDLSSANIGAAFGISGPAPAGGVTCYFEISGHTVNMP